MPVYNAAATVERAIGSVQAQSDSDWQLIIVDDVSTDDTLDVIDELVQDDARVTVLQQPTNQGPSAARNRGLDAAEGEYVCFLDSDDELTKESIATMRRAMTAEVDIVIAAHSVVLPSGRIQARPEPFAGAVSGRCAFELALRGKLWNFLHGKLFRMRMLTRLRFPIDVRRYEDLIFNASAYACSNEVSFIGSTVYHYHVDPSSLTWSQVPSMDFVTGPTHALQRSLPDSVLASTSAQTHDVFQLFLYVMTIASGMFSGAPEEATHSVIAGLRRNIPMRRMIRAVPANPSMAISALAIVIAPQAFSRLYRWHANRTFGLSAKVDKA